MDSSSVGRSGDADLSHVPELGAGELLVIDETWTDDGDGTRTLVERDAFVMLPDGTRKAAADDA